LISSLPANGKNPANYVKLRVNAGVFAADPKPAYAKDSFWVWEPKPL
jgi:hypothetical protein